MYSSDMKEIIARLGALEEWYVNKSSHNEGRETSNKMIPFYSTVRREVKEKLIQDFANELEFYYVLFPEEKGDMNEILGLNET